MEEEYIGGWCVCVGVIFDDGICWKIVVIVEKSGTKIIHINDNFFQYFNCFWLTKLKSYIYFGEWLSFTYKAKNYNDVKFKAEVVLWLMFW